PRWSSGPSAKLASIMPWVCPVPSIGHGEICGGGCTGSGVCCAEAETPTSAIASSIAQVRAIVPPAGESCGGRRRKVKRRRSGSALAREVEHVFVGPRDIEVAADQLGRKVGIGVIRVEQGNAV